MNRSAPKSIDPHQADPGHADLDEAYWRQSILAKGYYRPEVSFDRYRWALRYGQLARKKFGAGVKLKDVLDELAEGWKQFGGCSQLSWKEACDAVTDSWNHTETLMAESIASQGGYKSPPTFTEQGSRVPRNIDEPNA
jgi:hypothetical protein